MAENDKTRIPELFSRIRAQPRQSQALETGLIDFVWRLGYDRRAFVAWTLLAWGLMLVRFFILPPAGAELQFPNQPHNVNYVFGMDDALPQSWMPQWAWLSMLLVGLPTLVFFSTHLVLRASQVGRGRNTFENAAAYDT